MECLYSRHIHLSLIHNSLVKFTEMPDELDEGIRSVCAAWTGEHPQSSAGKLFGLQPDRSTRM